MIFVQEYLFFNLSATKSQQIQGPHTRHTAMQQPHASNAVAHIQPHGRSLIRPLPMPHLPTVQTTYSHASGHVCSRPRP